MLPALVTAFSTSSSAATLPIALECLEKSAGVSNRVCSLVLPLGIAVNLSASALYAAAVVTFIVQLSAVTLDTGSIMLIYFTTLLTSFGMAGIPSASLIVVVLVLKTLQIPSDHLAIIMAIERLADMVRTAVNVFATSCCAVIVARWEGETTSLRVRTL
jgi:Na+/H+-dicarboxylate symporter